MVGGGFIRAIVAGEPVSDVDVFADNAETVLTLLDELKKAEPTAGVFTTPNATTFTTTPPIQVVRKWTFTTAEQLLANFDFSIVCAVIWFDAPSGAFQSACHADFYSDLAAKRLVYTRNGIPGGTIIRAMKYTAKGYRMPLESLAHLLVNTTAGCADSAMVLGTLREVDPLTPEANRPIRPVDNGQPLTDLLTN